MAKRPPPSLPKINAVHKDIIYTENVRKEMKFFDKNRMDHF